VAHGILAESVRGELERLRPTLAVLPVGSTEVHGLHLPYGTDTLHVERLVREAVTAANSEGGSALMLPALPFSIDTNMMRFPYTITLRPRTLMALVGDIVDSVLRHGVRKFLLVNGHGGNCGTLEAICREHADGPAFVAMVNWWETVKDVVAEVIETPPEHACEFETSVVLALAPELVKMELAGEIPPRRTRLSAMERYHGVYIRPWDRLTPTGGLGSPRLASAEKGRRIVEAAAARLKELILELCRVELDETFPY